MPSSQLKASLESLCLAGDDMRDFPGVYKNTSANDDLLHARIHLVSEWHRT